MMDLWRTVKGNPKSSKNKGQRSKLCVFPSDLREAVSRLRTAEVNAVAGVLKLYFRELPEPLLPAEMFQDLSRILGMFFFIHLQNSCGLCKTSLVSTVSPLVDIQDINSRMVSLLSALHSCPDPNRHTFLYLLQHLQRLDRNSQRHLNASQPWILHRRNFIFLLLQSLGEGARQQDVTHEPGNSIWPQSLAPPCGGTGSCWPCCGHLPGGCGAGQLMQTPSHTSSSNCVALSITC